MDNFSSSTKQVLLICVLIAITFASSTFMFVTSNSRNINSYVEQTTDTVAVNIINKINNNLSTSIYTARAIAKNPLIIKWAENEKNNSENSDYHKELYNYLANYHDGNDYNFIFYASNITNTCYYQDGLSTKISKENSSDEWIYSFINSKKEYEFILNPIKSSSLSTLINYRLTNDSGETLGVIGVNVDLGLYESSIIELKNDYNTAVAFVDRTGTVVISTDYSIPKGSNIFSEDSIFYDTELKLIPIEGTSTRRWLNRDFFTLDKNFSEIRYIAAFDFYLLVYGRGPNIVYAQRKQLFIQFFLITTLVFIMIVIIIKIIAKYRTALLSLATLDELTKLMNRKSFMARYEYFSKHKLLENSHIFLIDIDFFKTINDTLGHIAGDEALSLLAKNLTSCIGDDGFIARWGGDEFIGIFFSTIKDPVSKLNSLSHEIKNSETGKRLNLTLSIGVAKLLTDRPLNKSVELADIALYTSKKNGRNCTTLYDESQTSSEPEYAKELIENLENYEEKEKEKK